MSIPQKTALYLGAFFDELVRWGVHEVVVSPGSRSTALAMVAYEMSCRWPDKLRLYLDIDERGASFLALGMAKASGRPVALVCTSGTAPANYYPAVIEAHTSRVPLIVLSGDRPLHAQGLGAVQTCDQVKLFGDYVRRFQQMPPASADARSIAYARQLAKEACIDALGAAAGMPSESCDMAAEGALASRGCAWYAGPVHLNFPLEEPLKPDLFVEGLFSCGRRAASVEFTALSEPGEVEVALSCESETDLPCRLASSAVLSSSDAQNIIHCLRGRRVLVLAGEGSCETADEARELVDWAQAGGLPLLADPLSGLRSFEDECVIDNYDNVFRQADYPVPDVVVRFGRYPVSKSCFTKLASAGSFNMVVDAAETRDFNVATDLFVPCTPMSFVRSLAAAGEVLGAEEAARVEEASEADETSKADETAKDLKAREGAGAKEGAGKCFCPVVSAAQRDFYAEWVRRNEEARELVLTVREDEAEPEGAYVSKLLELVPENSCLFSANSMSIRALDTFYVKQGKRLSVLCNRGQNGIDGTVSTAIGAAQMYGQTTFLTGDFTLLHDLNALALQRELLRHHGGAAGGAATGGVSIDGDAADGSEGMGGSSSEAAKASSLVIVLLNNNGGAIFDMLPQRSDDPYFERLFLVPQDVDFERAAQAFSVPYRAVSTVDDFAQAYSEFLGVPGISLVEVKLPLRGVSERYAPYQK